MMAIRSDGIDLGQIVSHKGEIRENNLIMNLKNLICGFPR
jgi:hypothetical protein